MTDGRPARARCEAHGLVYDPTLHDGCVVCRRGAHGSAPPNSERAPTLPHDTGTTKKKLALGVALLVVLNGVLGWLAVDRVNARRAFIDADTPTDPTIDPVVGTLPGVGPAKGSVMLDRTGTNKYGYPRDLPNKLALLALLRAERFDELTRHMESFQDAFEADFKKELWPSTAIAAFSVADPKLGPLIDQWVESNPESFAPYVVRAENTMEMAWHYRGGKYAELTAKARMERMREMVALVPVDAERALRLRPKLIPAYQLILRGEASVGATNKRKRALFQAAVRHCPYCVGLRATYLNYLRPRWGGSYADLNRVARDSQYPDKNPKLRTLLGFADFDRCDLVRRKNPKKALMLCNRALQHGPYGAYLAEKGRTLMDLERWSEANDAFERALEILPQNVGYLRSFGWGLLRQERYQEAADHLVLAARLDPVNENVQKNLLHILRKRVREAYDIERKGQLDEAIEIYTSVTRIHPGYVDAWFYRAGAYKKKGETSLAERDCLRAIEVDPAHFESYRFLDMLLFEQKRLDEIVEHWNRYLALRPKDANALLERAGTHHHKGEPELARRDLEASCALGNADACKHAKRFQ